MSDLSDTQQLVKDLIEERDKLRTAVEKSLDALWEMNADRDKLYMAITQHRDQSGDHALSEADIALYEAAGLVNQ